MRLDKNCRPRRFLPWELAKVGVEIVDRKKGILRCRDCGNIWRAPTPVKGCRREKGYWLCPRRCNGTFEQIQNSVRLEIERIERHEQIMSHWLFKPKCQCSRVELQLKALVREVYLISKTETTPYVT